MNFSRLLNFVFIALFGFCMVFQAEAQDKKSKKKKKKDKTEVSNTDEKTASYLSLADLLRRKGVSVQGSGSNTKVQIRGGSGVAGTDPLYVLDRIPIGNSYSQAEGMVDVNDIARIEVLKGADASQYGTRGMNGVIVIYTKRE